jgi:uncharacterized protein (AIM24 family)
MQSTITGSTLPVLQITLVPHEVLIAESGELAWKSPNVTLRTTSAAGGVTGLLGAFGRALAGGGLFMTEYSAEGGPGLVAFAAKVPGAILEEQVEPGRSFLVHRHGFLCGTHAVTLAAAFQRKLGSGIFGGNGFIMQKIAGEGTAWVELGGEVVTMNLKPGEVIDVHPGHVGMLEESVRFDITTLPGVRNKLFGGDGFFLARLTGPGRVWLQTLTVPHLAHAIEPYLPNKE